MLGWTLVSADGACDWAVGMEGFGVFYLLGFGVGSFSSQVPGQTTSMCDTGVNTDLFFFFLEVRTIRFPLSIFFYIYIFVDSSYNICFNMISFLPFTAALIKQSVAVKNKDIRMFLDGIYVSEKTTVVAVE